jgi:hypothetical protein
MSEERTPEQLELVKFLRLRWEHVKNTNDYFRHKLDEDERAWRDMLEANTLSPEEHGKAMFNSEYVIGRTQRFVMLIAICTFLEEVAREFICLMGETIKNGSGSDFEPCLKVLTDNHKFDQSKVAKQIEDFRHLLALRNCVTHQWGNVNRVTGEKRKNALNDALAKIEGVYVTQGGHMHFNYLVIPLAIDTAQDIGNEMVLQFMPFKPAYPK